MELNWNWKKKYKVKPWKVKIEREQILRLFPEKKSKKIIATNMSLQYVH